MARKEVTVQGKSVEELQALSLKELALLLPSRARRKINRGFTEDEKTLIKNIKTAKKPVKTHCRSMIVLPDMINKTIKIHNGKTFEDVMIQPEMVGHYLGEFMPTRRRVQHSAPGIGATKSSANVSVK